MEEGPLHLATDPTPIAGDTEGVAERLGERRSSREEARGPADPDSQAGLRPAEADRRDRLYEKQVVGAGSAPREDEVVSKRAGELVGSSKSTPAAKAAVSRAPGDAGAAGSESRTVCAEATIAGRKTARTTTQARIIGPSPCPER
jgi:hypothetical protein